MGGNLAAGDRGLVPLRAFPWQMQVQLELERWLPPLMLLLPRQPPLDGEETESQRGCQTGVSLLSGGTRCKCKCLTQGSPAPEETHLDSTRTWARLPLCWGHDLVEPVWAPHQGQAFLPQEPGTRRPTRDTRGVLASTASGALRASGLPWAPPTAPSLRVPRKLLANPLF